MRLFVRRVGHGLFPANDESAAEFDKMPRNALLSADVTQPRNIQFHRLYWALCARIGQGIGKDAEWISDAFKVETGHFTVYKYGGKEHLVLGSIAFHKFDEIRFRAFFEECVAVAYREWRVDPASVADLLTPEGAHVEGR